MTIPFTKYHGTGNDFIMIDAFENENLESCLSEPVIRQMCDRHFGIGADGLMILKPSKDYDFEMVYFNSDGRTSSMCGNGGRCIVKWAHEKSYIGTHTTFLAIDGDHEASIQDNIVSLKMIDVEKFEQLGDDYILNTGSPHYIRFVESVEQVDILAEARKIRNSARFISEGINVNFVENKQGKIKLRTYERGVENETLSCGTGVVASVLASYLDQRITDKFCQVEAQGGTLTVSFEKAGTLFSNVYLNGPAVEVFKGEFQL